MLRVAVIGCGTAGPAAALLLERQGHQVTLFERVEELQAVGAGVLIQPTGMAVLRELDLFDLVRANGALVERLVGKTVRGRSVLDLAYGDLGRDLYGLGVHRGSLHSCLMDAVRSRPIELLCGVEITGLGGTGSGTQLRSKTGAAFGPFNLVVVADGASSQLRDQTGLVRRSARYPWGALWTIVTDPDETFAGALTQTYRSTKEMLGFLPVGLSNRPELGRLVSFFWSVKESQLPRLHAGGLERWKRSVLELDMCAEPVLKQVTDLDQLTYAAYHDVRLSQLHEPGLVVIGDAAHAMSPQLGQGVNMALIDASVLAECVGGGESLQQSLERFSELRRKHLRYYQVLTRAMTPFFQSSLTGLGSLRDLLSSPAHRVSPLYRLTLKTLVGWKSGLFTEIEQKD